MLKKTGKRFLAVLLSVCMLLGLTDFSVFRVEAAGDIMIQPGHVTFYGNMSYSPNYNGYDLTPQVVKVEVNRVPLEPVRDYNITWPADMTNAGTKVGKLEAVPGSGYTTPAGGTEVTITIMQRYFNDELTYEIKTQKYHEGQPIVPPKEDVIIKDRYRGGAVLNGMPKDEYNPDVHDKIDYVYSCSNNEDITTANNKANILIEGVPGGNYGRGGTSITKSFDIESKNFTDDATVAWDGGLNELYTQGEVKKNITITENETGRTLVENIDYELRYSNNINAGTATIKIVGKKDYKGSERTLNFNIIKNISIWNIPGEITIEGLEDSYTYTGAPIEPDITVKDKGTAIKKDEDYTVTYDANTENGAAGGKVTIKGNNADGFYEDKIVKTFRIAQRDIRDSAVEVNMLENCIYNGQEQKPRFEVKINGIEIDDSNYDVSWRSNKNQGSAAELILKGRKNLFSERTKLFTIEKKSLTDSDINIKVDVPENGVDYDGTKQEPTVTVTHQINGMEEPLQLNTDYTLQYSGQGAGPASVAITGIGNYKDTVTKNYNINAISIDRAVFEEIDPQTYTGDDICPTVAGTYNGDALRLNRDYTVEYMENKNASPNGNPDAKVIIHGRGNYTGTKTLSFTILPKNIEEMDGSISCRLEHTTLEYQAERLYPKVILSYSYGVKRNELEEGTDFTVEYSANQEVGTATAKIKAKGNYKGELERSFEIVKRDITGIDDKITLEGIYPTPDTDCYLYKGDTPGTAIEPNSSLFRLSWNKGPGNEVTLQLTNDYTVTYEQNSKIGTAYIVIKGTGNNYEGEIRREFRIKGDLRDVDSAKVTDIPAQTYTGEEIKPEIVLNYGYKYGAIEEPVTTVPDSQYDVVYTANKEVGNNTAVATITAKPDSDYYGSLEKKFTIEKKDLGSDEGIPVEIEIPDQVYTGSPIFIDDQVSATYNGNALTAADFEVDYGSKDHTNYGEVTVTIRAKAGSASYKGEKTATFHITKRPLTDSTLSVTGLENPFTFDGENAIELTDDDFTLAYSDGALSLTEADLEYTYKLIDNDQVGTAYLEISALETKSDGTPGNFSGTVSFPFKVYGDLSKAKIKVNGTLIYTGSEIEPDLTVTFENKIKNTVDELTKDTHYTPVYSNNVNANSPDDPDLPTVTITGKPDAFYTGTNSETFSIYKKNLSQAYDEDSGIAVTGINEDGYEYTGGQIEIPALAITNHGNLMTEHSDSVPGDYVKEYKNNINVPRNETEQPAIVVSAADGSRNYTGSMEIHFKINPRSVENELLTAAGYDPTYDYSGDKVGSDITFTDTLQVFYGGTELVMGEADQDGNVSDGVDYSIDYRDNNKVGEAAVIITGHGNYAGTREFTYKLLGDLGDEAHVHVEAIEPQPYSVVAIEPKVKITYGNQYSSQELTEVGEDGLGDYSLSYRNNVNVADKNSENPPTVIIKGENYFAGSTKTVEVTFDITIRDFSAEGGTEGIEVVGLNPAGYEYTGELIEPKIVAVTNHKSEIDQNEYKITYENNIEGATADSENPPYVVITGTGGNYTGIMRVPFTITGIPLARAQVKAIDDQTFVSKDVEIKPMPEVTFVNSKGDTVTLKEGTNYTLEWKNNTAAGLRTSGVNAPSVVITGKGNYSGEITAAFTILPKDIAADRDQFKIKIEEAEYTGLPITPEVAIEDSKGVTLEKDTDYVVKPGTQCTDVEGANVTIEGKGNYSGQLVEEFTMTGHDLADEEIVVEPTDPQAFTSDPITPQPKVSWGDRELVFETDYTYNYLRNTDQGMASIIVTGTGNFSGTKTVTFEITKKNLEDSGDIVVADIENQVYSAAGAKPNPEVTFTGCGVNGDKDYRLEFGTDYTLTYKSNNVVGKDVATVVITGAGNFEGTIEKKFTIVGDIAQAQVSQIGVQNYTGAAIEPKPKVTYAGKILVEDTDYTLEYSDNVEPGIASVKVIGTNVEYGGVKETSFIITRDFSTEVEAIGFASMYIYSGTAVTPEPGRVTAFGKTLKPGTDYKLTYGQNINVGKGTVTVTGVGNYKGSRNYTFEIVRRSIALCTVSSISDKSYTGKTQKPEVTVKYGSRTLKKDADYSVVYTNNLNPGKSKIIIKGKGNFTGSKVIDFDIKLNKLSGVKASSAGTSKITVSWKKGSAVTGYEIYNTKNKRVARITGKTKYTISGLKAGTAYSYKVRSYVRRSGRFYYSPFSSVVSTVTKPSTPSLKVKSSKSKTASLSWSKASGASGYEIYRSTKSKSGFKKIATTTKRSYTNKKLSSKKKYYYKVRAYKTVNGKKIYGSYSSVKYVTIK